MNPEHNPSAASESPLNDCVKIVHPHSAMIQFVGKRMTWAFDWFLLNYVVLKANPDCHDPKNEPAQELIFYFRDAQVTLLGWHLDLMLNDIACHSISRVWTTERETATENIEITCISEIFVRPYDDDIWAEHAPKEPLGQSQQTAP